MAASLLTLGVLLGGGHAALAQQPITPAFTSPYLPKAPPRAAPAPPGPPLRSDAGVLHFTKESQAAPVATPLTFTKEAGTPETLSFTKEASTPSAEPLHFTKDVQTAPPVPLPTVVAAKPVPLPAAVVAKPVPLPAPVAAPPLPKAPLPAPIVSQPVWSPVSPYSVRSKPAAPLAAKPLPAPTAPVVAAPLPASGIQRTAMQAPKLPGDAGASDESQDYFVQLEPPGPQRLFRLESEQSLHERMRQEALQRPSPDRIEFPSYKPLSDTPFLAREWPLQTEYAEACYVCYGRLFFEELNAERYGWDLGVIAPVVSTLYFYKDLALLPYHIGTQPFCCFDCSAGHCLPGDPVPYLCYPPKLSVPGTLAEAGTVLALMAIFP